MLRLRRSKRERIFRRGWFDDLSIQGLTNAEQPDRLKNSTISLIMNSSPRLPCTHMCRSTRRSTIYALYFPPEQDSARSIKRLRDSFSFFFFFFTALKLSCVILWEANFKSHLGSPLSLPL